MMEKNDDDKDKMTHPLFLQSLSRILTQSCPNHTQPEPWNWLCIHATLYACKHAPVCMLMSMFCIYVLVCIVCCAPLLVNACIIYNLWYTGAAKSPPHPAPNTNRARIRARHVQDTCRTRSSRIRYVVNSQMGQVRSTQVGCGWDSPGLEFFFLKTRLQLVTL